jgi:RNA polymerase II subunit A-like phosphatase
LIVDLDQTIIHTTVDPTVGEWMAEVEEDEAEVIEGIKVDEQEGAGETPLETVENDTEAKPPAGETTTPPHSPAQTKTPLPTVPALPRIPREKNPNAAALKDVARFQIPDEPPPGYRPSRRAKKGVLMGRDGEDPLMRSYYTKPR